MDSGQYDSEIQEILQNIGNPNVDHNSIQPHIRHLNISFIVLLVFIIGLRILVRATLVKHVAVEDYLMLAAGVSAISFFALNLLGLKHGFGKHIWDIPLDQMLDNAKKSVQTLFICQVLYSTALALVKLSIVSTYWHIFPQLWMRRTLICLGLLFMGVWIVTTFATILQCQPVAGAWDFTLKKKCIDIEKVYYFTSSFSAFTDVILCILPVPLFWKLKLPKRDRLIVSSLFGLGLFAAAASIMRIASLKDLNDIDFTMKAMPAVNWSVGELSTGIICACIPPLKPLFKKMFLGKFFTSIHSQEQSHATTTQPSTSVPIERMSELSNTRSSRQHDQVREKKRTLSETSWLQIEMSVKLKTSTEGRYEV